MVQFDPIVIYANTNGCVVVLLIGAIWECRSLSLLSSLLHRFLDGNRITVLDRRVFRSLGHLQKLLVIRVGV